MLELKIALRYLFSRKTHSAVNVISLISVCGVAIATAAIVIVLSVFNGFERLAVGQLSQLDPDLRVVPSAGKLIERPDSVAGAVRAIAPGAQVVSTIKEHALSTLGGSQKPVNILGVDESWLKASALSSSILDGVASLDFEGYPAAIMGVGAAVDLQGHPGGDYWLRIYMPKRVGRINPANPMTAFRSDSLLTAGVFQTGHASHDEDVIIIPIANARALLDLDGEASSVEIWGVERESVSAIQGRLSAALGPSYRVLDRMQQEGGALSIIAIEKWITFAMLAFILIIASFNIVSTLCLLVLEKEGNMHIMLAMGATPKRLARIFVYEGWLVSFAGGVIGIILGVALTLAQQWGHFIKLSGDPSKLLVTHYPVELRLPDLLAVLALVALTGLLTSLITTTFARKRYQNDNEG